MSGDPTDREVMATRWRQLVLGELIALLFSALFVGIALGLRSGPSADESIALGSQAGAMYPILHPTLMSFAGLLIAVVALLIGPYSRRELAPRLHGVRADVDYWWPFLISIVWALLGAVLAGIGAIWGGAFEPGTFPVLLYLTMTAALNTLYGFARVILRLWAAVSTMILVKHSRPTPDP